jgi:hypothetical protein
MRPTFTTTIAFLLAVVIAQAVLARPAAANEPHQPEAPLTPFIDSGNTLPDLAARERHPSSDEPRAVRGPWYGWQILLGDLATTSCALALQKGVCFLPYFVTGPGVHFAHGRNRLAAASFGLRLLGPALGGSIGGMLANCPDRRSAPATPPTNDGDSLTFTLPPNWLDFCGLDYIAVGALAGAAVAAIVDASLGFERVDVGRKSEPAAPRLPTIEPAVSVGVGGVAVGIGAAF